MKTLAINTELHRRFCQQAKAYRQYNGWSQAAVANLLDCARSVVNQDESGRFCPTVDKIEKYAAIYGVTWQAFLTLSPATALRTEKQPA
jgi:transcriptional regulator with XRE-family HTH domain